MIRHINIVRSTSDKYPIRIEFWDGNSLVDLFEIDEINFLMIERIGNFIKGD